MSDLLAFLLYALTQTRIAGELPEQIRCCEQTLIRGCAKFVGCDFEITECRCEISYVGHCPQISCLRGRFSHVRYYPQIDSWGWR
jgi:hypothetical protein